MNVKIKGRWYNTNTAKLVGKGHADRLKTDSGYFEEELYRKRTGEYFIYGYGGVDSKYAKPDEATGKTVPGEGVVPITDEEAMEWGRTYMAKGDYWQAFCSPPEENANIYMGRVLRKYRKKKRLSQVDLAQRLDTSQPRIAEYENGGGMNVQTFRNIAIALGISPGELMSAVDKEIESQKGNL